MKIRTVLSFIQQIQKLEQDKNFVYFFRGHSKKRSQSNRQYIEKIIGLTQRIFYLKS